MNIKEGNNYVDNYDGDNSNNQDKRNREKKKTRNNSNSSEKNVFEKIIPKQ